MATLSLYLLLSLNVITGKLENDEPICNNVRLAYDLCRTDKSNLRTKNAPAGGVISLIYLHTEYHLNWAIVSVEAQRSSQCALFLPLLFDHISN